jgi:Phosphodiester glycosidase
MGATAADLLRSTIGPGRTAQIESVYLNTVDLWQQVQYHAGLTQVQAPWKVPATPVVGARSIDPRGRSVAAAHKPAATTIQVIHPLRALVSPSLPGEGIWTASVAPASPLDPLPLIAKAFIRPDPVRPYAIATILRFDLSHIALHMVAGTSEPGGSVGMPGAGTIPPVDQRAGVLLAAFNGGFKYLDGAYGMMVNRTVYVSPIADAATIAVTSGGRVLMGAWGGSWQLSLSDQRLVSWRQNGSLLIDRGVVNPLAADGGAWGTTVLNDVHTWRSAIGLAPNHTLLYVAGNALSVSTLALVLKEAGAISAMEMDINPFWVRAFFYGRDPARHLTMAALRPDMQGAGTDFLGTYSRDFFYLTRIPGRSNP